MQFFSNILKITSLKFRPLLMTNSCSRSWKLSMVLRIIAGGMAAISCCNAAFNCSIFPGRRTLQKCLKKIVSYVLYTNKIIFCVPCLVWFLLTFKMWESFLPHTLFPVFTFYIEEQYSSPTQIYVNTKVCMKLPFLYVIIWTKPSDVYC